jgi:hypothetical protein
MQRRSDLKRRFGIDLLYPTARYVNALRETELCWSAPDLSLDGCPAEQRVRNPLYVGGRSQSLVFLGGIVGVPWQSIASRVDQNQRPSGDPATQLRFKTFEELGADDTWSQILGSPGVPFSPAGNGRPEVAGEPAIAPKSPYMVESEFARPGVDNGNPINGREYDTAQADQPADLEYACIFPLPQPIDCSAASADDSCDCKQPNRPLCEAVPGSGNPGTTQYWSKAYPGTRQLQVLRDYGANSIVASICARNVDVATSDTRPDFGYRPAIAAIVDRLKGQLGNRCLPRSLLTGEDDTVACTLVEALPQPKAACECDATIARRRPEDRVDALVRGQLVKEAGKPCGDDDPLCSKACLCEVLQVQQADTPDPREALRACREDEEVSGVEGWCYVADTAAQSIGNPELVKDCRPTERRLLRFVGLGLQKNTTTFVACSGASLAARQSSRD